MSGSLSLPVDTRVTPHGILQELVLVYALAVLLLMLGARLRVPSIVALIVAGVIAGPAGVGLMKSQEDVDLLAEVGVALLLFTAGLEFSLSDLRRTWRSIVPGGLAQVLLTVVATGGLIALFAGGSFNRLWIVGLFVALSSTAVVLKELARRNHLHSPHGKITVGVLLLQDFVVIALLATVPTLLGKAPRVAVSPRRCSTCSWSAEASSSSDACCCHACSARLRRHSHAKRSRYRCCSPASARPTSHSCSAFPWRRARFSAA